MNLNDSKSLGSLLETDLDEAQAERSPAPRVPRMPYGCDQQGRYPMAFMPAEFCTELLEDDEDDSLLPPGGGIVIAVSLVAAVACIALIVHGLAAQGAL